jgi:hypothetical protein
MPRKLWFAALVISMSLTGLVPSLAEANLPPRPVGPPAPVVVRAPSVYTFPQIRPYSAMYANPWWGYNYAYYSTPSIYFAPYSYVAPFPGYYYAPSYSSFYYYSVPGYYPFWR